MSFFQKPVGATLLLGTAIGAPYVLYETEPGTEFRRAMSSEQVEAERSMGDEIQGPENWGPIGSQSSDTSLHGQTAAKPVVDRLQEGLDQGLIARTPIDLRQVIRFDVTPDFVYRSFPRVSTVLSDLSFDGIRVPLVSGTQAHDVAGSLTYYFDINKSVRRIQFQGVTGDAGPLVQLMIQHYRLNPERSLGGQLLTMRWNNRVTSFMHVAPAPVVSIQQPNARFAFFLEINKPTDHYGLSQEGTQMLMQAQATQRW